MDEIAYLNIENSECFNGLTLEKRKLNETYLITVCCIARTKAG